MKCISVLPIQFLGPSPKGRYEWFGLLAFNSSLKFSGLKTSGSGKYFGSWCSPYIGITIVIPTSRWTDVPGITYGFVTTRTVAEAGGCFLRVSEINTWQVIDHAVTLTALYEMLPKKLWNQQLANLWSCHYSNRIVQNEMCYWSCQYSNRGTQCHCSKSSTHNETRYENQLIFFTWHILNKPQSQRSMLYQPHAAEAHIERNSSSKSISMRSLTVKNFCLLKGVTENLSNVYWEIWLSLFLMHRTIKHQTTHHSLLCPGKTCSVLHHMLLTLCIFQESCLFQYSGIVVFLGWWPAQVDTNWGL